jgi:hypothetical protein
MSARWIGSRLVAEGIGTREELVQRRALGVDLGQGYLLGRPAAEPTEAVLPATLGFLANRQPTGVGGVLPRLGSIAVPTAVVKTPPTERGSRTYRATLVGSGGRLEAVCLRRSLAQETGACRSRCPEVRETPGMSRNS